MTSMNYPAFHRDPTLALLETEVVSCQPEGSRFLVEFVDTLFYPESGGQPADQGWVGQAPLLSLRRDEQGRILHELAEPVSGLVLLRLDFARRFDHMQQHSAQHLLTAVAQDQLGWSTTSFHLGVQSSDIELNVPRIEAEKLHELESMVNAQVREARPIRCYEVEPHELPSLQIRTRGLPEGHRGRVRLVEIEGLDRNTCGGTHLRSSAEIQAIKLVSTESLRGGTRLFFLAGGRVLGALGELVARERSLKNLLCCGPEALVEASGRLLEQAREQEKLLRGLRMELAGLLGRSLAAVPAELVLHHREDADIPFLNAVASAALALNPAALLLLTGGPSEGEGLFLLAGPQDRVAALGPRVLSAIEGRGGGARGRLQGKARRIEARLTLAQEPGAVVSA